MVERRTLAWTEVGYALSERDEIVTNVIIEFGWNRARHCKRERYVIFVVVRVDENVMREEMTGMIRSFTIS